jgi:type IV secretory pathway TraG/TraD family ATPase VirD4
MKAELIPALVGDSTIPRQLEGKQLLILGIDREKRDVLAPLIATVLHLLVNKNVTYPRNDPLFLLLDELPTLYLPSLHHWLNENREDGLCSVLGYQNMVQLENKYGKDLARAIQGGCATKFIFNPQDPESAKIFSDYLGEREVKYRQKSTGRSGGKSNTNYSDHLQTRPLFEASDFLKLPTGRCVILNPHLKRGKTAYIPLVESVTLGSDYKTISKWCQKVWPKMRERLIERSPLQEVTKEDLARRYDLAEAMFPLKTRHQQERDMFTALL